VPGNLPAIGFKRDVADGEVPALDGRQAADEVLGPAAGRICTARDLLKFRDDN
jgi:hypothetical protein